MKEEGHDQIYCGLLPFNFHLLVTQDSFYVGIESINNVFWTLSLKSAPLSKEGAFIGDTVM